MGRRPIGESAMDGAERARRWRQRHAQPVTKPVRLTGTAAEIANSILRTLGLAQARLANKALARRIAAIKPDCPDCKGTGFFPFRLTTACGRPLFESQIGNDPIANCDCSPNPLGAHFDAMQKNGGKAKHKAARQARQAPKAGRVPRV